MEQYNKMGQSKTGRPGRRRPDCPCNHGRKEVWKDNEMVKGLV